MTQPAHSPLGASSAERWMNCAGSVALIKELEITEETDEPEYRTLGTAAHAALAHCLTSWQDGWEVVGETFGAWEGKSSSLGAVVDTTMAAGIQVALDFIRPLQKTAAHSYIEYSMADPGFHPLYYGTVDFGAVELPDAVLNVAGVLHVVDFKYGEGIVIDPEWNAQFMYYAYGVLKMHPDVDVVRLTVIQPRIVWHPRGIIRTWEIDADIVRKWAEGTLRPAMVRTATNQGLAAGDWCRFCPAKLVCPLMKALFGGAANADPREVVEYSDTMVGLQYPLIAAVKHYIRALENDALRRLQNGSEIEGIKLVHKKADRVYKPEGRVILEAKYGALAWEPPQLKSPAQMELIDPAAKLLVAEYAFIPESGLTVAASDDRRVAVKVQRLSERFPAQEQEIPDDV